MTNQAQFEITRLKNLVDAYRQRNELNVARQHAESLFHYIMARKIKHRAATALRINTFCHKAAGMLTATAIISVLFAITDIAPAINTIAFFASTMLAGLLLAGTVLTLNRLATYVEQARGSYEEDALAFVGDALSQRPPRARP